MLCAVYALNPLVTCCSHGQWYEASHHHHTGSDVRQTRVIKATPHLTFKSTDLIEDIHNLEQHIVQVKGGGRDQHMTVDCHLQNFVSDHCESAIAARRNT